MYLVRLDTFSKVSNEFYGGRRLAIERYYYGLRDTIWKERFIILSFKTISIYTLTGAKKRRQGISAGCIDLLVLCLFLSLKIVA